MSKFNAGKASILALTAVLAVAAFLLGKSLTSVSATNHYEAGTWSSCVAKPDHTCGNGAGTQSATCHLTDGQSHDGCTSNGQTVTRDCDISCPKPEVSITKSILCGSGVRTFSGTADYHGDTTTRLTVTFNPPGSGNTTTEVDSQSEPTSWSFDKSVTTGSEYKIEAKVYDKSDPDSGDLTDSDSWTFTQVACPVVDVCQNLDGDQATLPDGMQVDEKGFCSCRDGYHEVNPEGLRVVFDGLPSFTCVADEPTPDPDVCKNIDGVQTGVPDGMHLDAAGINCVNFTPAGPPENPSNPPQGQILGTSTMAGTGSFAENLYLAIMTLGGIITTVGVKNYRKASKLA
jgi:hypothetical protein